MHYTQPQDGYIILYYNRSRVKNISVEHTKETSLRQIFKGIVWILLYTQLLQYRYIYAIAAHLRRNGVHFSQTSIIIIYTLYNYTSYILNIQFSDAFRKPSAASVFYLRNTRIYCRRSWLQRGKCDEVVGVYSLYRLCRATGISFKRALFTIQSDDF